MARPSATSSASAVAVTFVAWLLSLQLLLLPAPVSSGGAGAGAGAAARIGRSPAIRQFIKGFTKQVTKEGTKSLITQASGDRNGDELVGSAAAENVGYVIFSIKIGTTTVYATVDVLNDFIWVPCPSMDFTSVPCSPTCEALSAIASCSNNYGYCNYNYWYGTESIYSSGFVSDLDISVVSGTRTPITGNVVFGCSTESTVQLDGVMSFNKGDFSLLSQLQITKFSYFLDSSSSQSVLLFGDAAVPQTKSSRSTPLLSNSVYPNYYYVRLITIQVDGQPLTDIPTGAFDIATDGSGGVILSTIAPITFLQKDAYAAVRQALKTKIDLPDVNVMSTMITYSDLCYNVQSVANLTFPRLTLVFDGRDAVMDLTTVNLFYKDSVTGLQCLTMLPMPEDLPFGSILGSMLQAGTNMIYDINGELLTFEKAAAAPVPRHVLLGLFSHVVVFLMWVLLF